MTHTDGAATATEGHVRDGRYLPRRDVTSVPPQGGHVAKRCPLRVQFDLIPPPEDPVPESPVVRARMDEGVAFGAAIFTELMEAHPTAVHLGDDIDEGERLAATTNAMTAGVDLILAGRLPVDPLGRRTGKPDVLVRAGTAPNGGGTYLPIDVKHHKTLSPRERDNQDPALVSLLVLPSFGAAHPEPAWVGRPLRRDALQLAHYHRMLEACGHAHEGWGGIIGKERQVTWIDLDLPRFRATWKGHDVESALQRYDFEFAFRLDVLAAALDGESLVEPVYVDECGSCPWYAHCRTRLEESDSVSLLPLHGYVQWHTHRRAGVTTRRDLAGLDRRTALLRDSLPVSADVSGLLDRARAVAPDTRLVDLVELEAKEAAVLAQHRVVTAGDLLALDPRVLSMHNAMVGGSLAGAIDVARVAVFGDGSLFRRRGVTAVDIPSAGVEIDIDMETTLDGTTYLWGALIDGEYVPFVDWGPPGPLLEAGLFLQFWEWVQRRRHMASEEGESIVFYCWSASAERGALTSGAALAETHLGAVGARAAVAEFVGGLEFVDLLQVLRDQLESGGGNGLKVIAPRAGFSWRDQEPSGDLSMLWHRVALAGNEDGAAARRRLLEYNEDDVRATAAVRSWLRSTTFPAVEDIEVKPAVGPTTDQVHAGPQGQLPGEVAPTAE